MTSDEKNVIDETIEAMNTLAMEKDDSRAIRYVATVRPAMATVRYMCSVNHPEQGRVCRPEENACAEMGAVEVCSTSGTTTDHSGASKPATNEVIDIAVVRQARKLMRNQTKRQCVQRALTRRREEARTEEERLRAEGVSELDGSTRPTARYANL